MQTKSTLIEGDALSSKNQVLVDHVAESMRNGVSVEEILIIASSTGTATDVQRQLDNRLDVGIAPKVQSIKELCYEILRKSGDTTAPSHVVDMEGTLLLFDLAFAHLNITQQDKRSRIRGLLAKSESTAETLEVERLIERLTAKFGLKMKQQLVDQAFNLPLSFKRVYLTDLEDLTQKEWKFVTSLNAQIYATADPGQSIYGFTGADLKPYNDFALTAQKIQAPQSKQFSPSMVCFLSERLQKHHKPRPHNLDKPILQQLANYSDEKSWISRKILDLATVHDIQYSDIAILLKSNRSLIDFSLELDACNIPWHSTIQPPPLFLALFKFLHDPSNQFHIFHLVHSFAPPELSMHDWAVMLAGDDGLDMMAVNSHVQLLDQLYLQYQGDKTLDNLMDIVQKFVLHSSSVSQQRVESFLVHLDHVVHTYSNGTPLDTYLNNYWKPITNKPPQNRVTLSTIHSAKGAHWDHVFLPQLNDNIYPYFLVKSSEAMEEQRRVFNVAISRARQQLYGTFSHHKSTIPLKRTRYIPPQSLSSFSCIEFKNPKIAANLSTIKAAYPLLFLAPSRKIRGSFSENPLYRGIAATCRLGKKF